MKLKIFVFQFAITFLSIFFLNSCYITKESKVTINYLEHSVTLNIPKRNSAAAANFYLSQTGSEIPCQFPEYQIDDFNIAAELKKIGLESDEISSKVVSIDIDSVWFKIDSANLNTTGADFDYFNSINLTLNDKNLGTYVAPYHTTDCKEILFNNGDNFKNDIINNVPLTLKGTGKLNSMSEVAFKVTVVMKIKMILKLPFTNPF